VCCSGVTKRFVERVAEGRNIPVDVVKKEIATGQTWTGLQVCMNHDHSGADIPTELVCNGLF
jgi:hypothetical protein